MCVHLCVCPLRSRKVDSFQNQGPGRGGPTPAAPSQVSPKAFPQQFPSATAAISGTHGPAKIRRHQLLGQGNHSTGPPINSIGPGLCLSNIVRRAGFIHPFFSWFSKQRRSSRRPPLAFICNSTLCFSFAPPLKCGDINVPFLAWPGQENKAGKYGFRGMRRPVEYGFRVPPCSLLRFLPFRDVQKCKL